MNPQCKACQGTTSVNTRKTPQSNPKMPDYLCNQDNGRCGSDVQYMNRKGETVNGFNPTPTWKPKEGGFDQYAQRPTPIPQGTPMVKAPNGQDGYVPVGERGFIPEPVQVTDGGQAEMWKKKGEQMNRSNLGAAFLQAKGTSVTWTDLVAVEAYVLSGKTPQQLAGQPTDLDDIASSIPF